MHVKQYTKKYFKIGNSFPKDKFEDILEFLRSHDPNNTEDPPEPRKE
jgi:hypothetical protein